MAAEFADETLNNGLGARFGARNASKRSAQAGDVSRGGGGGGDAAGRPVDAAARVKNYDEVTQFLRCTNSTTSGAGA
jgi:hypothetical protein